MAKHASPSSTPSQTPLTRSDPPAPPEAVRPKMLSNQEKLPRLPIPDLEKSLEGYVRSLIPLLEQKYGSKAVPNEIEKRRLYARDFAAEGGLGRVLQERLKDLDMTSPNNWLNDSLWLGLAYHTWRAPLLINSSWWLQLGPDPKDLPPPTYPPRGAKEVAVLTPDLNPSKEVLPGSQGGGKEWLDRPEVADKPVAYEDIVRREDFTDWQIRRASWIVRRFAEYKVKVRKEEITPEISNFGPYDMIQYTKIFNMARIPQPGCDQFSNVDHKALHATFLIDDFVYSIDVFAPAEVSGGVTQPLAVAEIELRIKAAVADVRARKNAGEQAAMVGLLTADERDSWTRNRERLLQLSSSNRAGLDSIGRSLLTISLDPYTLPSIASTDPLRLAALEAHVRNSASGIDGARNRWFDKIISVAIETNGRASYLGEHSPVEASVPGKAVDYVLAEPLDEKHFKASQSKSERGQGWERCDWVVDEGMQAEILECQDRNRKMIADSDASGLFWGEYGVEWIKKHGKQSPDAFIQQAMQLAWYEDQGYATATYETASLRSLLHGRTDVVRTLSSESRAWVAAMLNPDSNDTERFDLLTKACTAHVALTRQSSAGRGFDRHLMGLKTRLQPGEKHALFEDEMYAKSQAWKLSTSSLGSGPKWMGAGFGAAWPDGYGINYLAGPNLLKFGIESKWSCPTTSTAKFKHRLVQALRDMRRISEASAGRKVK